MAPYVNVKGNIKVTPMTKEDLKNQGIDLSNDDNFNVVKYTIEAQFGAAGVAVNHIVSYDEGWRPVNQLTLEVDGHKPITITDEEVVEIDELHAHVIYSESVNEKMLLFISGESKWLKEFYDVHLIVWNEGNCELTNCSAVLNVPDGLTAVKNSLEQGIPNIPSMGTGTAHWYLRGDKEGVYSLKASFKATSDAGDVCADFISKKSLRVYSSSAIKMYVMLPQYSYYKQDYPIKIILENVSNKPIYDLMCRIPSVVQKSEAELNIIERDESSTKLFGPIKGQMKKTKKEIMLLLMKTGFALMKTLASLVNEDGGAAA